MYRCSVILFGALFALSACRQDMHDAPRYEEYEAAGLFPKGMANIQPLKGAVARGSRDPKSPLATGKDKNGAFLTELPFELTAQDLQRGQERYQIFCSPCHDSIGSGQGMVVKRGFKSPGSYHTEKLRGQPLGYFFDVMTNGYGVMYNYRARLSAEDRWRVAAYVRTLQLSQYADISVVPSEDRPKLGQPGEPPPSAPAAEDAHTDVTHGGAAHE